jgi:hypothetical protein
LKRVWAIRPQFDIRQTVLGKVPGVADETCPGLGVEEPDEFLLRNILLQHVIGSSALNR